MTTIRIRHIPAALGAGLGGALLAGTAAAAEAGGGGGGSAMPQLNVTTYPGQVFWLAVTFAVLFIIMWKVALPRVGEVIEARQQKIAADLERAEKLKQEVDEITADYEKTLADARAKAQEEMRKAQDKIKADQAKKQEKIDADLASRVAEAEERIDNAREAAMEQIRDVAEEIAGAAVEKLTGEAPDGKAVKKAVETAAKEA